MLSPLQARRDASHATSRRCVVAIALVAVAAGLSADARDRPGAPNGMVTYECWGDPGGYIPGDRLKGPPAICTYATNTAKEKVRFIVRVTANGVEQDEAWLGRHVVGWYSQTNGPLRHEASDTYFLHRPYFTKSYHERQALALWKLDFDTVYCVSLRTAYDNGVVSADWTSTPCVRTRRQDDKRQY